MSAMEGMKDRNWSSLYFAMVSKPLPYQITVANFSNDEFTGMCKSIHRV